jgi:hypothetical protein
MDGTTNAFYDASDAPGDNGFPILPDGVTITPAGTFVSNVLKDNSKCLVYDGSTNYIALSYNSNFDLGSGDFTICAWKYISDLGTNRPLCGKRITNGTTINGGWAITRETTNKFTFSCLHGTTWSGPLLQTLTTYTTVGWYYIVLVKSGSTITFYINLIYDGSIALTDSINNYVGPMTIGSDAYTPEHYTNGSIKDFMIFKKALTLDQIGALMDETYIY